MKTKNLLSVYQGAEDLEGSGLMVEKKFKTLKIHEIKTLHSFCDIMSDHGCDVSDFDGFYVGYSIHHIGKEFDLLRFGDDLTISIELKSELNPSEREIKVLKQARLDHYYLKLLGRPLRIYTYVENDYFYKYSNEEDRLIRVDASEVANCIQNHNVNYNIDPDKEFIPSKYLISPFNSTEKFLNGEYFLTTLQQTINNKIYSELFKKPFKYFTISAGAGMGKTLLVYDIAKNIISDGNRVIVIHCGRLNNGQKKLNIDYNWNIWSIGDINEESIHTSFEGCKAIIIDEAQRIGDLQLELIIQFSIRKEVPVIFAYDVRQYLQEGESRDIAAYLKDHYPDIGVSSEKLHTKIRTNSEIASFIERLFGTSRQKINLDYGCVTIEYLNNMDDMKKYLEFLRSNGWTSIRYTTEGKNDPYILLSEIIGTGQEDAHEVIGQEFSKVVCVMDSNFAYNENNVLIASKSRYSAEGMLYQIVTRVVDELKIVVFNNPGLYSKLLEIKSGEE